ncbi:DUF58 domain-containing protein [Kaarinaea lacus]
MHISLRGYLLILLVVLLGIIGQWTAEPLQHLWRYPAAAVILALLYEAFYSKRAGLSLQRELPPHAALGRKTTGKLTVHNHNSLPLKLKMHQPTPLGAEGEAKIYDLAINGHAAQSQSFTLFPQTLGDLCWDTVYTRVQGFFGLAWWNRKFSITSQLTVEPDYLHRDERNIGIKKSGEYNRLRAGSGSELLFLRDYRAGDSMRAIDWKATARSGKHMVRVFTEEQHLTIVFAIDAGRTSRIQAGRLSRYYHYVNICARLAEKAVTHNDLIGLVVFADKPLMSLPPARGTTALVKLRQALTKISPSPQESNPLAAASELQRWLRHRSLVVLLSDLDISDVSSQIINTVKLLSPKHLPLIATLEDEQITALAEAPAEHAIDPYNALAAMEMSHEVQGTILRLQRLGACVVKDRAERLDDSVLRFYEQLRQRRRI